MTLSIDFWLPDDFHSLSVDFKTPIACIGSNSALLSRYHQTTINNPCLPRTTAHQHNESSASWMICNKCWLPRVCPHIRNLGIGYRIYHMIRIWMVSCFILLGCGSVARGCIVSLGQTKAPVGNSTPRIRKVPFSQSLPQQISKNQASYWGYLLSHEQSRSGDSAFRPAISHPSGGVSTIEQDGDGKVRLEYWRQLYIHKLDCNYII